MTGLSNKSKMLKNSIFNIDNDNPMPKDKSWKQLILDLVLLERELGTNMSSLMKMVGRYGVKGINELPPNTENRVRLSTRLKP